MCRCVFFFFKLKTAYEMRISDWSSDVCSSDLRSQHGQHHAADPGDASAQPEDEGVYQPRIDPHGGGGGAILVDRADQQAGAGHGGAALMAAGGMSGLGAPHHTQPPGDRKSTRLNSSH